MCRSTFGCRGGLLSADPYSERLPSLPTGDELQSIDATTEVCDHIQLKVPALCLPLGPTPMVWTDLICGLVNYMYDFRFISSCLRQSGQAYDAQKSTVEAVEACKTAHSCSSNCWRSGAVVIAWRHPTSNVHDALLHRRPLVAIPQW